MASPSGVGQEASTSRSFIRQVRKMKFPRKFARRLFALIPSHRVLHTVCSRYVDRFNGDNETDPEVNGEYLFLRSELPKLNRGIVFDAGANVGNWAKFALCINPRINLHCFEPSRATYARLAQRQWPEDVRLNNVGLGDAEGVLDLNVVELESGMNSVYLRRGVEGAESRSIEKINVTTIDAYCRRNAVPRIDLLKVDVEGHEMAVFKGAGKMLAEARVGRIQFEYGGCNLDARVSLKDIWEFLEQHGFAMSKLYPKGPRVMEKYRQSLDTFKYSNWLAVRRNESVDAAGLR